MADLRGGIDLGGTKIQTVVVDAEGKLRGEARQATPTEGGPAGVARAMEDALREAASAAGVKPEELAGVGVGSPGDADGATGVVSGARNLPGWEGGFALGETLSKALGTTVRIGNDVQVAVEGEYELGAGRPYDSLIGVWWGTGLGGGLILDRKPWLGRGAAGELGHTVVKRNGARCPCGRRGCLEAYVGRAAMEARAKQEVAKGVDTDLFEIMEKRGKERLTSSVWEHALREGDALTESLLAARDPLPRHGDRLRRQPARRRGGCPRRRPRRALRRPLHGPPGQGDAQAPLCRRPPTAHARRRAGRPGRRDRRQPPRFARRRPARGACGRVSAWPARPARRESCRCGRPRPRRPPPGCRWRRPRRPRRRRRDRGRRSGRRS